jgi:hypothetical protein
MHITNRDGNEHLDMISIKNSGPDANKLTVLSRPEPSVESSDVFISKNFTNIESSCPRLLISFTSRREQAKQNSPTSLKRLCISVSET